VTHHDVSALHTATWRKSSRSNQEGQCVEIALTVSAVGIRDSKNVEGGYLIVESRSWAALVDVLKRHEHDT
jgi:hypothetical protein